MLRQEVVAQRHWMSDARFLDLLAATNLIPGPNSTEMVIHVGQARAGWRGLIVAGTLFILPAMLITLAFAWAYQRYGQTPEFTAALTGVKPVVIAVIVQAIWGLGKSISHRWQLILVAVAAMILALIGVNELVVLFGLGLLVMLGSVLLQGGIGPAIAAYPAIDDLLRRGPDLTPLLAVAIEPYSPFRLFWEMLKIGGTLYGSGYVLISFLQQSFVEHLGWLTEQQLIDAVAIGQFTPGPVSSTATFVGYLVGGWLGAVLATIAIFLPAFVLVAISHPLLPRLRASRWASGFLDGVSSAAIGLMAAVTIQLAQAALISPFTVALALAAALLLIRFRINSAWLIIAGGLLGSLARPLGL